MRSHRTGQLDHIHTGDEEGKTMMKLHDNPEIPPARRNPQELYRSHKLLDIIVEMGLKPGRLYWRRLCRHHLSVAPPN
jgi:hypothetical protein